MIIMPLAWMLPPSSALRSTSMNSPSPMCSDAADARRFAKRTRMSGEFDDRQGVNLADAFAFGFNHYLLLQDFILNPLGEIAFTPLAPGQHGLHLFRGDLPTFAERRCFSQLTGYPERAQR
ncbi:Uncharacterised protein [Raoultella planticola]|uniref:Uncharacterized protein n=1 Tax=Raoultella planticola TaxID=575 RepID=A0A485A969_RAOPL|nr:Uncharacterised protein [Raoultella planticola]